MRYYKVYYHAVRSWLSYRFTMPVYTFIHTSKYNQNVQIKYRLFMQPILGYAEMIFTVFQKVHPFAFHYS